MIDSNTGNLIGPNSSLVMVMEMVETNNSKQCITMDMMGRELMVMPMVVANKYVPAFYDDIILKG